MADRVCVMSNGRAEQVATPSVLYAQPSTAFVAEFVGVSSRLNVARSTRGVNLFGSDAPVRGDVHAIPHGDLDALVRPEDVSATVAGDGLGIVTHRSFLGGTTRLDVGYAGATIKVDVRSSEADAFELGTRVTLGLNARDVLVTGRRPAS